MAFNRSNVKFVSAVLGAGMTFAVPASAQAGFFEQLFGIAPQASPFESGRSYEAPARPLEQRSTPHHARKHVADAKPNRQKPTDLFHDASLRPGDAVMMKDGIHVYQGEGGSVHDGRDFVAVDASRELNGRERAALVALDTTRNDPLRGREVQPDTLASGRSAAVGAPVSAGFKITDARGASVRYVGP